MARDASGRYPSTRMDPALPSPEQTLAGPLAAGRWTSLQNGIGNLSGIAASWFTGFAVEHTHSFAAGFLAAALIVSAGAFFWGAMVGKVQPVEWRTEAA